MQTHVINLSKDDYALTTDRSKIDVIAVHHFLSTEAYWSKNIPFEKVKTAIENSLCFGVFHKEKQVGFARVLTDYAAIAYLGDVYILPEYREKGLSKWLMETIMSHPNLQGLRRWILLTRSAHELYKKYGWKPIANPGFYMEVHNPNPYE